MGAKIVYKPFGLIFGIIGGILAGALFKRVWRRVGRESQPPHATDRDRRLREVVAAAALEGAVFGGVKALIDRGGATAFERATGLWPGDGADRHPDDS